MQQIRSTLFRQLLEKITQDRFNPSIFNLAFISRTSALLFFTLVLFINQVYLSLHLYQYRSKVGFK